MKPIFFLPFVLASLVLGVGCGKDPAKPNVELIQDMMDQPALKAQREEVFFADGVSERVPPDHTVPVGFTPYKWGDDAEKAAKENKNPLAGNMSPEVLKVGQTYFERACLPCHGAAGAGDGLISLKFPLKIPPLISDKIKGWNDAQIYHVISRGQGVMGSYATIVPQKARWQVVNYVRTLQKK